MAVDDTRRQTSKSLQVSAWRHDANTVVLNPNPERPAPTSGAIVEALDGLRREGHQRVLTGALHDHEIGAFTSVGFTVHERLHLLRHDLDQLPAPPTHPLRRAWRRDRPGILAVDALAFDDFWTLDDKGLDAAVRATPSARSRVLGGRSGSVRAYAVTGRAGNRGYVQRLAVHPDHHRQGIGESLVSDALHWLVRRGVSQALVNTQERNAGAYALYLRCGFVPEASGLTVLTCNLGPTSAGGHVVAP